PEIDAVEGLAALVDQSLVQQQALPDGEVRFSMLETVREFAVEELAASGEAAASARAHGLYYMAQAEAAGELMSPNPAVRGTWLAFFLAELANFRAAFAWTRDVPDGGALQLRLVVALDTALADRGYATEATAWLDEVLARTEGETSPERARVL